MDCPSQEDFEYFDADKNGILMFSEWADMNVNLNWEKRTPNHAKNYAINYYFIF